jgi:hypothetical protein
MVRGIKITSSAKVFFSVWMTRSTTDTLGVGTRRAMPAHIKQVAPVRVRGWAHGGQCLRIERKWHPSEYGRAVASHERNAGYSGVSRSSRFRGPPGQMMPLSICCHES